MSKKLTLPQVIEALQTNAMDGADELDWRTEMLWLADSLIHIQHQAEIKALTTQLSTMRAADPE